MHPKVLKELLRRLDPLLPPLRAAAPTPAPEIARFSFATSSGVPATTISPLPSLRV
jgi:hypothetical protein